MGIAAIFFYCILNFLINLEDTASYEITSGYFLSKICNNKLCEAKESGFHNVDIKVSGV